MLNVTRNYVFNTVTDSGDLDPDTWCVTDPNDSSDEFCSCCHLCYELDPPPTLTPPEIQAFEAADIPAGLL